MPVLRTLLRKLPLQWFRFPYAILPKLGFSIDNPGLSRTRDVLNGSLKIAKLILMRNLEKLWVICGETQGELEIFPLLILWQVMQLTFFKIFDFASDVRFWQLLTKHSISLRLRIFALRKIVEKEIDRSN